MSGVEQDALDAGAWASNHVVLRRRFQRNKVAEIKRFEGRLRILEEEEQVFRGVFLEVLDGRAKIMAEIYENFENLQHCFNPKQQQTQERWSSTTGDQIKGRRAGLLQVLRQETNPSLVNRGLKAKALV